MSQHKSVDVNNLDDFCNLLRLVREYSPAAGKSFKQFLTSVEIRGLFFIFLKVCVNPFVGIC